LDMLRSESAIGTRILFPWLAERQAGARDYHTEDVARLRLESSPH